MLSGFHLDFTSTSHEGAALIKEMYATSSLRELIRDNPTPLKDTKVASDACSASVNWDKDKETGHPG